MPILVIAAAYGTSTTGKDVTKVVQSLVIQGQTEFTADNDTMGGDPDEGVTKKFAIIYLTEDGQENVRAVTEGDVVKLA